MQPGSTMRLLTLGALCACLLGVAQGSAFYHPVPEHPNQPGKCSYSGLAIAVGQTVTEHTSCTELTCSKKENAPKGQTPFAVSGLGCNHASSFPDNCYLETPDLTKDYPECCPRLECDGLSEGGISFVG